jgi:ATP-dependent helicase HrpB
MAAELDHLPIVAVLGALESALAGSNRAVLAAPPGAGKTTQVPLALLKADWLGKGKIIMLEPRRIAARMAAERMASLLGEQVGDTVGVRARFDVVVSARTRIEIMTEGVFTRLALSDPGLEGVGAVIFDEFHERALDADLGLALALDCQAGLREDLRVLVMSATLDTARIGAFLNAPVVESQGRAFPVETRYIPRPRGQTRPDPVAATVSACERAWREESGSILAFLPGQSEIRRCAERLEALKLANGLIAPLYGALSKAEQRDAVRPAPAGLRKIVLATDIAESALTIEGVRVVIDAGLARVGVFDPDLLVTRLETRRASLASANQRRGRAGRTGPGVCYRLWDEAETRGLAADRTPEIHTADLSGLALDLLAWGARGPDALNWLDPPSPAAWARALETLTQLGALTHDQGNPVLTPRGKAMTALPLPPRLAVLVLCQTRPDLTGLGARIAALLSEPGYGGREADLRTKLARLEADRSERGQALKAMARRWSRSGADCAAAAEAGAVIAAAWPDRIARARPGQPGQFQTASGRGAQIDLGHGLAGEPWLAIADMTGQGADLYITAAAPMTETEALALGRAQTRDQVRLDRASGQVRAERVRKLGAIVLSRQPLPDPGPSARIPAWIDSVREDGPDGFVHRDTLTAFLRRHALARQTEPSLPVRDLEQLFATLDDWLGPALKGATRLSDLSASDVARGLEGLLDGQERAALARFTPRQLSLPLGDEAAVLYHLDGGPTVQARVQALYGLDRHPHLPGGTPIRLELLSPARRVVATTSDLPGFWRGGYLDMRKDMRGRYPKHDWPEQPWLASPQRGVKRRT